MPILKFLKALARLTPVEKQSYTGYDPLAFSNYKDLYGREPRQGEIPTEKVAPASYLAGQVSGGQIAGGAPGPRFGTVIPLGREMEQNTAYAMNRLPKRVSSALDKSRENIMVQQIPQDYIGTWHGGYLPHPGGTIGGSNVRGLARISERAEDPAKVITHELTHGALDIKGKLESGPDYPDLANELKKIYPGGYNTEKEILPYILDESFDPVNKKQVNSILDFLSQTFGLSPAEMSRQSQLKRAAMKSTER